MTEKHSIREEHKDYGYRHLWAHMRNMGYTINHKAVQRIVQKRELQVRSFTHKSRKNNSYKEPIGKVADNLLNRRFKTSMSRKGDCLDNSVMENFFGLLKQEIYYRRIYHSCEELKAAIAEYIIYYNERHIKKSLGWMSPAEYRRKHAAA